MRILKSIILSTFLTMFLAQLCPPHSYYDLSTLQCQYCDISCTDCLVTPTNCTGCTYNYYILNSTCTHCPLECISCNSSSICNSCKLGYYLVNNTCYQCGSNCMACNSTQCHYCTVGYNIQDNCTTCASQFYFNSSLNLCDLCQLGCLQCQNKTFCLNCRNDYLLNVQGECQFLGNNSTKNSKGDKYSSKNIVIIVGSILGVTIFVVLLVRCVYHHKKQNNNHRESQQIKSFNRRTDQISKEFCLQFQTRICILCKNDKADMMNICGHSFHQHCFDTEKKCPHCEDPSQSQQNIGDTVSGGSKSEPRQQSRNQLMNLQESEQNYDI